VSTSEGPTRRDAQSNLRRVLDSAAAVFASHGLDATLADVAKHAGVGVGTVYRRFANKDDLIYDVYAPRLREVERFAREASAAEDVWAGFAEFFERSIRSLAVDKGMRELTMGGLTETVGWARGTPPDRLLEMLKDNHQAMGVHLTKLVARAKKAGALRADFQAADMMILSLAVQSTIALGGSEKPELYRRTLGFVLDGLRPASATPLPVAGLTPADIGRMRGS
jgi:AcrR family transcriptional regulator